MVVHYQAQSPQHHNESQYAMITHAEEPGLQWLRRMETISLDFCMLEFVGNVCTCYLILTNLQQQSVACIL